MLRLEDALPRLHERGLVGSAQIVAGGVRAWGAARRNLHLVVELRDRPGFLLKQPDPGVADTRLTVRREADFYRFCSEEPGAGAVAKLLPRVHLPAFEDGALLVELAEGAQTLSREWRLRPGSDFPEAPSLNLGAALGALHAAFRSPALAADPRLAGLSDRPPAYLAAHQPRPLALRYYSPAQLKICRLIQTERKILDGLDKARAAWRVETLIHGDIRSDNVLVVKPASDRTAAVLVVDWELVRWGDPAWDVGGALQDFVVHWILGMSLSPQLSPAEQARTAKVPLAAMRPAMGVFWGSYLDAAGIIEASDRSELLERAVGYVAVRLVQSAFEHSSGQERVSSLAVLLLQLSANLFADPTGAAREIFGLGAAAPAA